MAEPDHWSLHEEACARGARTYIDPVSGYQVFTRIGLLEAGRCCGAGCRHCPFGHERVRQKDRATKIQQPAWLTDARPASEAAVHILFWSGGKDSYLALRALQRDGCMVVLLTTFDARSRIIAHQELPIDAVVRQAIHLCLPLIGVPLHHDVDYLDHIAPALELVPQGRALCFGDLHLQHIRGWRENAFANDERTESFELRFPIWQSAYDDLLDELEAAPASFVVGAVNGDRSGIAVGDTFDRDFVSRLPSGVDAFGENGEFHTRVVVEALD